jgi:23S rRNA (uracil1939-C5)-methyltransferase
MEYGAQLRAKDRVVSDAMQRIARRDVPGITMHRSESEWRYRRKLTFELRRDRESFHAGLHPYDNPSALFTPGDCLITQVQVMDAWHQVLANVHHLPRARRLRCSVLVLDDGAHLSVGGGNAWTDAEALAEACPALVSISWTPSGGSRKRVFSRGTETRAGASFAQINDSVARALRDFVCAMAMRLSPADAVDAYCGTGEVALAISALGVRVSAIESDPDAVSMFRSLLPEGSTASVGLVEDLVAAVLPTDLVLLNPPRSGIEAKVALALARAGAVRKGIIYISCNPATLARDLARLPGFIVQSLDCFDMFPQTAHVETVCLLLSPAQS